MKINIKKISLTMAKPICCLVVGLLIVQVSIVVTRDYSIHQIKKTLQYRNQLYINRSQAFSDYEIAVSDYANQHNTHNKKLLLAAYQDLNAELAKTAKTYGLDVKRWIDLYEVWALQSQEKIFTSPQVSSSSPRDTTFFSYEQLIEKAVTKAEQLYKNNALEEVLYPKPFLSRLASWFSIRKVQQMYHQQAKGLMPAAAKKLREEKIFNNQTPPLLNLKSLQSVAANIAYIQYGSRYAPFSVNSNSVSLCNRLKQSGSFNRNTANMLAICEIASQRLRVEAKASHKKYGQLSYLSYFKRDVAPLIPHYKEELKAKAQSNNIQVEFNACDPGMQPVVGFRDPRIDARVAAYEMNGFRYCWSYFRDRDSAYAQMQVFHKRMNRKNTVSHISQHMKL